MWRKPDNKEHSNPGLGYRRILQEVKLFRGGDLRTNADEEYWKGQV